MKISKKNKGAKFKPGDFVYIRTINKPHKIGLILKFSGIIKDKEIYQVIIGKEVKYYNEYYLDSMDQDKLKDFSRMRKN